MAAVLGMVSAGWAQQAGVPTSDLTDLPVEELLNLQVTSVGRKAQQLAKAPAAVFVITQEDLRRSGYTTVADALRMVPGLSVGRIDGTNWAVSARGFQRAFSDKLLVLVDGRSVYMNMFSGVFWDVQDLLLEDIDRIEVIRGPGAVMWGANAVNGVINVITRPARSTQGGLVSITAGNESRPVAGVRWGGQIGGKAWYRVYAKGSHHRSASEGTTLFGRRYFGRDSGMPVIAYPGQGAADWNMLRTGFRLDWDYSTQTSVTVQGDVYGASIDVVNTAPLLASPWVQLVKGQEKPAGGNLLARITRPSTSGGESVLQVYFDKADRRLALADYSQNVWDIDYQRRRLVSDNHEIYWGVGFRGILDSIVPRATAVVKEPERMVTFFSGTIRDEFSVVRDRLLLSGGIRVEHNSYTGVESQPSVRLLYTPTRRQSLWGAWSRAVRTPSRLDHDLQTDYVVDSRQRLPVLIQQTGNPLFESEKVFAHEVGYRHVLSPRWSVDGTAFLNRYTELVTRESLAPIFLPTPKPHVLARVVAANNQDGRAWGAEVWGTYSVSAWWKLMPGYTFLTNRFWGKRGTNDPNQDSETGTHPRHQFQIRSWMDITPKWQVDAGIYAVDRMVSPYVPGYAHCDLRVSWRPDRYTEIGLQVLNTLDRRTLEVIPEGPFLGRETGRTASIRLIRRF